MQRTKCPWHGHAWLADRLALDLVVTLDDATSAIYAAVLVEEEGTASSFFALAETIGALGQLGIEHIAGYSPEARGHSERAFRTLQSVPPRRRGTGCRRT